MKKDLILFLEHENLGHGSNKRPARTARVQVVVATHPSKFIEIWIDLDKATVLQKQQLVNKHPYIDSQYMQAVEKVCLADPAVQEHIKQLQLPEGATVIVEAWAYATDGLNDMSQRTTMVKHSRPVALIIETTNNFTVLVLHAFGR